MLCVLDLVNCFHFFVLVCLYEREVFSTFPDEDNTRRRRRRLRRQKKEKDKNTKANVNWLRKQNSNTSGKSMYVQDYK